MPNTIELNLLENRSIVAKMQGYPLANENSYKIIAGEENATIFKVVSIPNQYADKSFTIEMVNAKGYGIEETPIVNITNYEFSLPVGMAVAGYAYVLFRAKYTENGKEVVVPFQPLKVKVWNTLPEWKEHISNSTNVRIENGYLIINEDGKDYNLGYVKGEKGDSGDIASQKIIDDIQKEISDLYLLSNATVTGTEEITDRYTMRQTANGLNGLIDGALTKVTEIKGSTVRCENLFDKSKISSSDFSNCTDFSISEDKNVLIATGNEDGNSDDFGYLTGWVFPLNVEVNKGGGVSCEAGDTVTVSADITLITQGSRAAAVRCYIYHSGNTGVTNGGWEQGISTTKKRLSWSFSVTTTERYYPIFAINSNRVRIENIKMSKGGSTEYQPYFSDLKHANISGIKSTGRNLLNLDLGLDNLLSKNSDENYTLTYGSVRDARFSKWFPVDIKAGTYYYQAQVIKETIENTVDKDGVSAQVKFADGTSTDLIFWNSRVWTYVFTKDVVLMRLFLQSEAENWAGKYKTFKLWLSYVSSNDNIEPYTEEIYQLPETLELGEWDSFNAQTGELIRQTGTITFTGTETFGVLGTEWSTTTPTPTPTDGWNILCVCNHYTAKAREILYQESAEGVAVNGGYVRFKDPNYTTTEEFKAHLAQLYNAGTPVIVSYKLDAPTIEKIENAPKLYKAWKHGSETVIQGDIDNSEYGAKCAITQIYAVKKGVSE